MVVLGVTGCIGAYKACEVLRELQKRLDVQVVMTEHATRFVSAMTFEALSGHPVFVDQFALGAESDIRHISLADAADLLLVARPANTIGKFARGIADDALSTLFLATKAPVLVAPAMNVNMFEHPAVLENIAVLRARGVQFVEPGSGYLACGWLGKGAWPRSRTSSPRRSASGPPAIARRPDGGGDGGADGRGHRRALRLEPLERPHGLPAGRGRARPGGARRARFRSHRADAAGGRRDRERPLGGGDGAGRGRARARGRGGRDGGGGVRLPAGGAGAAEDQEAGRAHAVGPRTDHRHPTLARSGQGRAVPGRLRGGDDRPPGRTPAGSARRRTWT